MKNIIEKNLAELIIIGLFIIILLSSCGSTNKTKDCCQETVQETYEELVVNCQNCDEID